MFDERERALVHQDAVIAAGDVQGLLLLRELKDCVRVEMTEICADLDDRCAIVGVAECVQRQQVAGRFIMRHLAVVELCDDGDDVAWHRLGLADLSREHHDELLHVVDREHLLPLAGEQLQTRGAHLTRQLEHKLAVAETILRREALYVVVVRLFVRLEDVQYETKRRLDQWRPHAQFFRMVSHYLLDHAQQSNTLHGDALKVTENLQQDNNKIDFYTVPTPEIQICSQITQIFMPESTT